MRFKRKAVWMGILLVMLVLMNVGCGESGKDVTVIDLSDEEISEIEKSVPEKSVPEKSESLPQPVKKVPIEKEESKAAVRVGVLKGPSGMGMSYLINQSNMNELKVNYEVVIAGSPDQLVGKIAKGDLDIIALPTNLAANLYQKTEGKVQLLGVNTLGVLYMLEKGTTIKKPREIAQKEILASGKGGSPEFVTDYIIKQIIQKEKNQPEITYAMEHNEVASALLAGKSQYAILPEPFVTTVMSKDPEVRILMDFTKEWRRITHGRQLPMGCIVVNKKFAEKNPDLVRTFINDYRESVDFVNTFTEKAGRLIVNQKIIQTEELAIKAIPRSKIVWVDAMKAKEDIVFYLTILLESNPKSIGGELPDDAFYYKIPKKE